MPLLVHASDSMALVIQLLAESRLHHVYVVDLKRRPVGAVSLTDIIQALVKHLDALAPMPGQVGLEAWEAGREAASGTV